MNKDEELSLTQIELAEARRIIKGIITETGYYDALRGKWEINTSSILTRLIQEAGRWCEYYASDLFIQWKYNIEDKLDNGTLESGTEVFAFRQSGVDGASRYERNKDEPNYYRVVWFLDIETEKGKIKMTLHK